MSPSLDQILEAETDLALFLILCGLIQSAHGERPLRVQLESIAQRQQSALCLSIRQIIRQRIEQQTAFQWQTVHWFILDEAGRVTWQRVG